MKITLIVLKEDFGLFSGPVPRNDLSLLLGDRNNVGSSNPKLAS